MAVICLGYYYFFFTREVRKKKGRERGTVEGEGRLKEEFTKKFSLIMGEVRRGVFKVYTIKFYSIVIVILVEEEGRKG